MQAITASQFSNMTNCQHIFLSVICYDIMSGIPLRYRCTLGLKILVSKLG